MAHAWTAGRRMHYRSQRRRPRGRVKRAARKAHSRSSSRQFAHAVFRRLPATVHGHVDAAVPLVSHQRRGRASRAIHFGRDSADGRAPPPACGCKSCARPGSQSRCTPPAASASVEREARWYQEPRGTVRDIVGSVEPTLGSSCAQCWLLARSKARKALKCQSAWAGRGLRAQTHELSTAVVSKAVAVHHTRRTSVSPVPRRCLLACERHSAHVTAAPRYLFKLRGS